MNDAGNILDIIENQTVPKAIVTIEGSMHKLFEKSNYDAPEFVHVIGNNKDEIKMSNAQINQAVNRWKKANSWS